MKKIILLLTGLVLMALPITSAIAQEAAPNFTLTDIDGANFSLNDQRGKVVLLDFFTTDCLPCQDEMATLYAIHQEFGENLVIVSISINPVVETVQRLQQFRQEYNMTWTIVRDTDDLGVSANYSVNIVPTLVIIDKEGNERYNHTSLTDESVLQQEISTIVPEFGTWIPVLFIFLITTIVVVIERARRNQQRTVYTEARAPARI